MVENFQLKLPASKGHCLSITEKFKWDPSGIRLTDRSRDGCDVFRVSSLLRCPLTLCSTGRGLASLAP